MRKHLYIAATVLAAGVVFGATTFTDVNTREHKWEHGLPSLIADIDANFALLEDGGIGSLILDSPLTVTNSNGNTYVDVIGGETNEAYIGIVADDGDDADDICRIAYTTSGNLEIRGTSGTNIVIVIDGGSGDITTDGDITVSGSDLTLNAAGVKLTGDGDGALTILGLGDGSDEDITFNLDDTANECTVSSSTSLNMFNLSAIGLKVGKEVDLQYANKTANYTMTATDCVVSYNTSAATTNTLPEASTVLGTVFIIALQDDDGDLVVKTDGTDKFDGTNDILTFADAGDSCIVMATAADVYTILVNVGGTLSD